jgi:hypothetical protein
LQNLPLESRCVVVAFTENYSNSNPLKFSPKKSQILSCDTVVANERFVQAQNRIPPLFERSKTKTVDQSSLAVYLKKIMQYEGCSLVSCEETFAFRCCAEQKQVVMLGCVMLLLKYSKTTQNLLAENA